MNELLTQTDPVREQVRERLIEAQRELTALEREIAQLEQVLELHDQEEETPW